MICLKCILYIPTAIKDRIFLQTNCFRFVNVANNTTIINFFNIDKSNIPEIKTLNHLTLTCSKSAIETLEKDVKYVQS